MNTRRKVLSVFGGVGAVNTAGSRIFSFLVFMCLLCTLPNFARTASIGICAMDGCNCTVAAHHWIIVKCIFADNQDVELQEGTVPSDAMEVEVSRCRELKIQSGAFTGGAQLKRVRVSGIQSLVAKKQAFQNLTAPNPLLEVSECKSVIIESHAYKNARGPLSVSIARCVHVAIKPNAFSWLLRISLKEIENLQLSSNAFKFEAPPHGRHGPATKILFQSVMIPELPTAVFPSMAAEVRMDDFSTKVIRKEAFCAIIILSVAISNATIYEVEAGAFSDRTLIHSLEFVDVSLKRVGGGALRAAVNNLTIQYSRLTEVESGAIDIAAASVTFNNNEFQKLRTNSIVLHQWNHLAIDYNLFENIEGDAITVDENATVAPNFEFSFTGNRINKAMPGSLKFAAISLKVNSARIGNNVFNEMCSCNLETWTRTIVGTNASSTSWMMDSSFCIVDSFLGRCHNVPEGKLTMRNYTRLICNEGHHIECKVPSANPGPSVSPPSVGPHVYPRPKGYFDVEMSDPEQLEREKRIIMIICVLAVFFVVLVILLSGILYMRRQGVCPKLSSRPVLIGRTWESWFSPSTGVTAATSARSISRLSVHEYAGLQPETRILEVGTHRGFSAEEGYAYTENKATQTLPEELTEEYLRELRERLNDPENYSQARDMIEHLYDLIKVEESCNNNNNNEDERVCNVEEENAYDVIRPRARVRGPARPSTSVGTRVPSLEKLLPSAAAQRPPIAEYTEPRDNRLTDQNNHLYAELPGDETVPSTSRLSSQPALATRAPQPLPPDVLNNINDNTCNQKSEAPSRVQARPLSFLKALGESILGNGKTQSARRPNSLLCEYADPSDATAHLYSELPEPRSSTSASKMANRPLPTKPDQESAAATVAAMAKA
ncbi:uncharacterized protein LOC107274256 [Cephus cinctus]|uniref:Uncharacterized protein LOC107274256 n=1 Tax=Cephus cinctus TaxID=211228 RepID=A0AAJ7CEC3_CEPCN|nr:uncharacterized protein LOC107274256 [Cephus cinctus]